MAIRKTRTGRTWNRGRDGKRRLVGATRDDTPRNLEARTREQRALDLRKAGLSYEAIAAAMGFAGRGSAHKAVHRALEEVRSTTAETAESFQQMHLLRYEHMISQLWPFCQVRPAVGRRGESGHIPAQPPDPRYVQRLLQVMAQKEALLGMQQPKGQQAPDDPGEVARKIKLALAEAEEMFPKPK